MGSLEIFLILILAMTSSNEDYCQIGKKSEDPFQCNASCFKNFYGDVFEAQGFLDSDIMKVTGHASSSMVASYDKTSQEVNATEKIQLVT